MEEAGAEGGSVMKFAMSYSCGKDSTLALHKLMDQGHEPVCLIVMVNREAGRSWFHGASPELLDRYEAALGLPMIRCPSGGTDYRLAFEDGLKRAQALGAEAACFGDIDIAGNRQWEEDRCKAAGLIPCFPLWRQGRAENVRELVALGYRCLIKSVDPKRLPLSLLGQYLDGAAIAVMEAAGADICGENGEYHTLTVDGPVFRAPVAVRLGEILELEHHAVIDIR